MASSAVYLDWNATTPICPEVAEEMLPFLTMFGNPSSSHAFGRPCKEACDRARGRVANLLGCKPAEVFFVSGGTEADNWAVKGSFQRAPKVFKKPKAEPYCEKN